jgi:molybdopterin synthase catalytic subunit
VFRLSASPIEAAPLREALLASGAGAYASFEGWVRDHNEGRGVRGLAYEAYAALAEAEGARVLEEARARFEIVALACVHRTGELAIGSWRCGWA